MTRIIAGVWGGRRLSAPKGSTTRPTTDRVREAVFSSLQSHFGSLEGLRVLDAFAGSGALALEALSRGAVWADLVEQDAKASAALQANIGALAADQLARVHRTSAAKFVSSRSEAEALWDIVFLDPPYDFEDRDLAELISQLEPFVDPEGIFVVERSSRSRFVWPHHVKAIREKKYGETQIWYGR